MTDRRRLFEVAVRLAARQSELARQRRGGVGQIDTTRQQAVSRIQSFGLLCIG